MTDDQIPESAPDGRLGRVARVWAEKRRGVDYEAAVLVELAIDAADMADRAREMQDDRLYLAAATRLQQLMKAALHDDDSNGSGSDPWSAAVAGAMGAGPGMGNTPKS